MAQLDEGLIEVDARERAGKYAEGLARSRGHAPSRLTQAGSDSGSGSGSGSAGRAGVFAVASAGGSE